MDQQQLTDILCSSEIILPDDHSIWYSEHGNLKWPKNGIANRKLSEAHGSRSQ